MKTQWGDKVNYNLEDFELKSLRPICRPLNCTTSSSRDMDLLLPVSWRVFDCPLRPVLFKLHSIRQQLHCKVKWAQCCMQEITEQVREELFRGLEPKLFIEVVFGFPGETKYTYGLFPFVYFARVPTKCFGAYLIKWCSKHGTSNELFFNPEPQFIQGIAYSLVFSARLDEKINTSLISVH